MSTTHFSGPLAITSVDEITSTTEVITTEKAITELNISTAIIPIVMEDGETGVVKTVVNTGVDTPQIDTSNVAEATAILFSSPGDSVTFIFAEGLWYVLSFYGASVV